VRQAKPGEVKTMSRKKPPKQPSGVKVPSDPAKGAIDLWFIADSALECKEQNNLLEVPQVACPGVDIE
jgi:hypothetical protein